jgi:hypothetical protein
MEKPLFMTPSEVGEIDTVDRVGAIAKIALGIAVAHRQANQPLSAETSWKRLPTDVPDMPAAAQELEAKGWKITLDYMGHKNDHAGSGLQIPEHPCLTVLGYEGEALALVESTSLEDAAAAYCEGMFLLKVAFITEGGSCNLRMWEAGEHDSMLSANFIFFDVYQSEKVKIPMDTWSRVLTRFLSAGWTFVSCRPGDDGDPNTIYVSIMQPDSGEPPEPYYHDFILPIDWEANRMREDGRKFTPEIVVQSGVPIDTDKVFALWRARKKNKIPDNEEWSIEHSDPVDGSTFITYTLRRKKRDA